MKFLKNVKCMSLAMLMAAAVSFTACNSKDATNGVDASDAGDSKYSLTLSSDIVTLEKDGDSKTVTVTTNGSFEVEVEAETVATAEVDGKSIVITPQSVGTTIIIVTCKEDKTIEKEITVKVEPSEMKLTLNLADSVAVPGGTVTFIYGNGGDTNADAYDYYESVDAEVSDDGKTAVCYLKKSKANEWGWYNGLKITVKDSSDSELSVKLSETYFEYAADGYTLNVSAKDNTVEKMTAKLSFTDFTADSVNVTYGCNGNTTEVSAEVSSDGSYATVEISNEYANDDGWLAVMSIAVTKDNQTIETQFTGDNYWFEFAVNTTKELTYSKKETGADITSFEFTGNTKVEAASFAGLTINSIIVEATECDWSQTSGNWWIWCDGGNLTWQSNDYYTITITDADTIANIVENGLTINALDNLSATITVSYK